MRRVRLLIRRAGPVRWLFLGDSITQGVRHTRGLRDYTQHFAERCRYELGRGRDLVLNAAVSGQSTRDLLADLSWRTKFFRPDAVFLMMGMNDCTREREVSPARFSDNLDSLCARLGKGGALVILQTSCPPLPGTPQRETTFRPYMKIVRQVAARRKLPLIDHERWWRRHAAEHFSWMDNPVHPNGHGHSAMAHLIFRRLGILTPQSETGRVPAP